MDLHGGMWTRATRVGTLSARSVAGDLVMPYSGLMPSIDAIQQAVREPLSRAPREHQAFAAYIFERAREIDHERALAKTLAEQRGQPIEGSVSHVIADA